MKKIAEVLLQLVQVAIFLPAVLLELVGTTTHRWSGKMIRGPYYAVVRKRRQLKGEPLWQAHDSMIGIPNPEHDFEITKPEHIRG